MSWPPRGVDLAAVQQEAARLMARFGTWEAADRTAFEAAMRHDVESAQRVFHTTVRVALFRMRPRMPKATTKAAFANDTVKAAKVTSKTAAVPRVYPPASKQHTCRHCGEGGHNARTCLLRSSGSGSGSREGG